MQDALKDIAYEYILEKLEDSHIRGGDMLSEAVLAKSLGTSRGPVREAITRLAAEGFLEQVPGSGTYIRIPERQELEELYQVREWLECAVLTEGGATLPAEVITQLEDRQVEMHTLAGNAEMAASEEEQLAAHNRFRRLDREFHQILLNGAGNRLLMRIIGNLGVLTRIFVAWRDEPGAYMTKSRRNTLSEHGAILAALREHDVGSAVAIMRTHIRGARQRALAQYDLEQAAKGVEDMPASVPDSIQYRLALLRRYRPGGVSARRNGIGAGAGRSRKRVAVG